MKRLLWLFTAAITLTVLQGVCRAEDKREAKPRMKGVELYSWKDKDDAWYFVLADGTNRQKTEKEIKEHKDRIKGAADLKKALALLAEGERVLWSRHRLTGFEFPPEAARKDLVDAAKEAKVKLDISLN